ncbi:hypothetical protein FRC07_005374, partial [Ceratobasidium sp. 392]
MPPGIPSASNAQVKRATRAASAKSANPETPSDTPADPVVPIPKSLDAAIVFLSSQSFMSKKEVITPGLILNILHGIAARP